MPMRERCKLPYKLPRAESGRLTSFGALAYWPINLSISGNLYVESIVVLSRFCYKTASYVTKTRARQVRSKCTESRGTCSTDVGLYMQVAMLREH